MVLLSSHPQGTGLIFLCVYLRPCGVSVCSALTWAWAPGCDTHTGGQRARLLALTWLCSNGSGILLSEQMALERKLPRAGTEREAAGGGHDSPGWSRQLLSGHERAPCRCQGGFLGRGGPAAESPDENTCACMPHPHCRNGFWSQRVLAGHGLRSESHAWAPSGEALPRKTLS